MTKPALPSGPLRFAIEAIGFKKGNPMIYAVLNFGATIEFVRICERWHRVEDPEPPIRLDHEENGFLEEIWKNETRRLGIKK